MPHPSNRYFDFPLIGNQSSQAPRQTPIPLKDIRKIPHLSRAVAGVFETFGEDVCDMFPLSDRFRVYVRDRDQGQQQLFPGLLRVAEALSRTASELQANLAREVPQPLAEALTSQQMLPLLRAVSHKGPQAKFSPTYTDEKGTHGVPILEPRYFVDPSKVKDRSRTGQFPISGVNFEPEDGFSINVTADRFEVVIGEDLVEILRALDFGSLRDGLFLHGTIEHLADGRWSVRAGGRIVHQLSV